MLEQKTQEKMREKKDEKEGKMPKIGILSAGEEKVTWARAVDKYQTGQGEREEPGGGVTLKDYGWWRKLGWTS